MTPIFIFRRHPSGGIVVAGTKRYIYYFNFFRYGIYTKVGRSQEISSKTKIMEQIRMSSAGSKDCAFCRIMRGEAQCYMVFEDEVSLAFLDRRPLFPGHCLLVPREHIGTLADLPSHLISPLFSNARLLARAVEQALGAEGSFVAINNRVSQSVPHLHIHIVPRRRGDGLRGFFWPRQLYKDQEAILKVQDAIRSAIARLREEK